MSSVSSETTLKDELNRSLTIAISLSNLRDEDFATLQTLADVCLPWADQVATQIRRSLEATEATRVYANTYLNGNPAAWYRGLFQTTGIHDFWFRQIDYAIGHVQNDVPNEVVVGLAPRWINMLSQRAQHELSQQRFQTFMSVMPRMISGTVIVLVATREIITTRTFMEETGFSTALIRRLRQNMLKTFIQQIEEERQRVAQENGETSTAS